jgi:hypothetical protein
MNATEPNGWELQRSIDQLRADQKDDLGDLKSDVSGIGAKIDRLGATYVTRNEHAALAGRVTTLEEKTEKRTDRNITIWLAVGTAMFSVIAMVVMGIFQIMAASK